MSKYKRTPIFFNKNTVAVIHIFTRCDFFEDLWMDECISAISPENPYELAAQQFIDQFEDHWTPIFLMEFRKAITEKLQEHDKVYGTKFAQGGMMEEIEGKPTPIFIKGAVYRTQTHGVIEFIGMDNWRGDISYHFKSYEGNEDYYLSQQQVANL